MSIDPNHTRTQPAAQAQPIQTQTTQAQAQLAAPTLPIQAQPVHTQHIANTLQHKGARPIPVRPGDKRPSRKGSFKNATSNIAQIASQFQPNENVGVATGHLYGGGIVALDVDVPKDSGGIPLADTIVLKRLIKLLTSVVDEQQAIMLINEALWVRTASGGWQLWFMAEQGAELVSRDHIDLSAFDPRGEKGPASDGTSFDTRGERGYAVAPGSVTVERTEVGEDGTLKIKQAAGEYQAFWLSQKVSIDDLPHFSKLAILPAAVIELINSLPIEGKASAAQLSQSPNSPTLDNAPAHTKQSPLEGGSMEFSHRPPKDPQRLRDALSHSVSQSRQRYASRNAWFEVMSALAGAAAAGELDEEEGDSIYEWFCENTPGNKSDNADQWQKTKESARERLRHGEEVRGCKSIIEQAVADGWIDPTPEPTAIQGATAQAVETWPGGVRESKNGTTPLVNSTNAGALLERLGFEFRYITRGHFHEVHIPAEQASEAMPAGWQTMSDAHARQLMDLVIRNGLPSIKLEQVVQAFKTLGDRMPFDPFKAELEGLPAWDGTARVEEFPFRYLGAELQGITAAWAKHFFMQLLARTYQPGCKADEVLVLLGAQRTGKSTALRAIVGDPYFTDALTFGDKPQEIVEKTHGTALAEIAELQGLSGRGADKNKAMISRQEDRARLAFDKGTTHAPRSFVLAGTGNDASPFNDPSGALRFMPVTVGVADIEGIRRDREQILAEAIHKFRSEFGSDASRVRLDPKWWAQAKQETEKYHNVDPWEIIIETILEGERERLQVWTDQKGRGGYFIRSNDLLGRLLPPGYNKTRAHSQKLSRLMARLGFNSERPMLGGKREYGYFRPFTPEDEAWRNARVKAGQPVDQGAGLVLAATLTAV